MADLRDAFAPLDEDETTTDSSGAEPRDVDGTWLAELPAPEPLPDCIQHPWLGTPSRVWPYHDEAGKLLFAACRFDEADADGKPVLDAKGKPKKQVLPFVFGTLCGRRGWHWKAPPRPRPLYGLDCLAMRPGASVLVTEGEKDADGAAARFPEYVAVTSSGGANAAAATDWTPLAGRTVIVWSDNDQAGTGYATAVAASLRQAGAASVRVVQVPGSWPVGWGLADAVPTAADEAMLQRLLDEATAPPEVGPAVRAEVGAVHTAVHTGPPRESKREKIIEAVLDAGVEFWRDARGEAYATVPREGRLERYPVKARDFRNIALLLFGDANPVAGADGRLRPGSAPGQAMAEAIQSFEAVALRSAVRDPRPRLCRGPDGAVWIDLGGPDWGLVRVAPEGWRSVEKADLPLIRPSGMLALPAPMHSVTALDDLRRLLNLASAVDFMLVVAWLVAALHPEGPYPVLALDGEQGSGKSTASRMLRRLVDPNHADARAAPRDERDLVIAARNGRVVALDNLSGLDAAMADALCRVATGGGFGERMLYTNAEEHVVRVQNPVLLNGIPSLLARGDLADRAIAVTLPAIPDERRRPEAEVWREFDTAAPGVLALLLDGLALALRNGPGLRLTRLPRMADFARIACAAAPAFGWTAEGMLNAIEANRSGAVAGVIESDPVAVAVQALAEERRTWSGTATALLQEIDQRTPTDRQRMRDWPKDATRLSGKLRRAAPALRRAGVEVSLPEAGGRAGRIITIVQKADQRSERSERSADVNPAEDLSPAGTQRNAGASGQRSGESLEEGRSERWAAGNAEAAVPGTDLDEVVL